MLTNILEGVKIIDLTRYYSGPFATQILADLGADVIKIEHPKGDETRRFAPFFNTEDSAYFATFNRGKKSKVINIKDIEERKELIELIKCADVLVENFAGNNMEKYGLSYNEISRINPSIIFASLKSCKDESVLGFDLCIQAMSGFMNLNKVNKNPEPLPISFADGMTGIMSVIGILSSLYKRNQSKKGQHIKVYMLDTYLAMMEHMVTTSVNKEHIKNNNSVPTVPYGVYKANDGYYVLAIGNDAQWERIVKETEIFSDKWYNLKNCERLEVKDEIEDKILCWSKNKKVEEIVDLLRNIGIPTSPIISLEDSLKMNLVDSDFLVSANLSDGKKMKFPSLPILFSDRNCKKMKIPLLGQDNEFGWK